MRVIVSIIVPVHNVSKYLTKCLSSIVAQSIEDIEIICINDGSTDDSLEILNEYALSDRRIFIINQPNQGQGCARNLAISRAKGKYIGFVDADDWIEPDMFETLHRVLISKSASMAVCNYNIHLPNSIEKYDFSYALDLDRMKCPQMFSWKNIMEGKVLYHCGHAAWNGLYKRKFLLKNQIKFAPYRFFEDHPFVLNASLCADKIAFCPRYLYHYNVRASSSLNNASPEYMNVINIVKEIERIIKIRNLSVQLSSEFDVYAAGICYEAKKRIPTQKHNDFYALCKQKLSQIQYELFCEWTTGVKRNNRFTENLFSLRNAYVDGAKFKVVTFFGIKYRFKVR